MARLIVFIILIIVSSSSIVEAQYFDGGLIAGITASQIDNDDLGGYNKFGLKGGLFVNHEFSKQHIGQIEMSYVQRGAAEPKSEYSKRLDYVEIACLYKHRFADSAWNNVEFEAGISSAFLITEENTVVGIDNHTADFADFDMPANVGISYFIADRLAINARLSYSLADLGVYRNNSLSFSLYYYFR